MYSSLPLFLLGTRPVLWAPPALRHGRSSPASRGHKISSPAEGQRRCTWWYNHTIYYSIVSFRLPDSNIQFPSKLGWKLDSKHAQAKQSIKNFIPYPDITIDSPLFIDFSQLFSPTFISLHLSRPQDWAEEGTLCYNRWEKRTNAFVLDYDGTNLVYYRVS